MSCLLLIFCACGQQVAVDVTSSESGATVTDAGRAQVVAAKRWCPMPDGGWEARLVHQNCPADAGVPGN